MNRLLTAVLAAGIGALAFPPSAAAAIRVWDGGGVTNNWSDAANWSGDVAPNLNDLVTFDGTSTRDVVIDAGGPQGANVNIGILQIRAGYTGTITQAPGVNLRMTVDFNQSEPLSTFIGGSGDVDVDQNFFLSGGTFTAPAGRLFVGGNFAHTVGSFLHNDGTLVLDAFSANISVPAIETFNNLTFNAVNQTKTIVNNGRLIVTGTLVLADGGIVAGTIEAQADVIHQAAFDGGTTTIRIVEPAPRTITLAAGGSLPNVVVNAPNVTVKTAGSGTIKVANFTLQAGTVEQGSVALSFFSLTSFTQSGGTYVCGSGSMTGLFRFTLAGGSFIHGSALLAVNDLFAIINGAFMGGSGDIDVAQAFTLSGGTFTSTTGRLLLGHNFIHTAGGTFLHNGGTVVFDNFPFSTIDVGGTETFHGLTFSTSRNIAAGDTLIALGTLTLADGSVSVGTLSPHGNLTVGSSFDGGSARVTFSGAEFQTVTNLGGMNPSGTWTVNKAAGAVTLASHLTLGTSQALTIASGVFDLGTSFNLTTGALTIGAAGTLRNAGTGDLTLGGNLANNGLFDFNGGGIACGDGSATDPLLIRSSQSGTARHWSGGGAFSILDVDVKDQNASSIAAGITAFASTSSGNTINWFVESACPVPVEITAHPAGQNVCAGDPAAFAVAANGDTITFQWRRNGVNLVNGGNVAGSTSAVLTINPATEADSGSYDAVATDRFGRTATSSAAVLTATICSGHLITFEGIAGVEAMSAANGTPVPLNARLSTELQASNGVSFSSIGGYVAVVHLGLGHAATPPNGIGGVDSSSLLDYNAPIVITFSMPGSPNTPAVTDFVSIRGDLSATAGAATMEAFDVSGSLIGSVTSAGGPGGVALSISIPNIHSIRLLQTQADVAFDNLRFNELSPALVPGSSERPTAHAGEDRPVRPGETVTLDGSGSSDDNTATEHLMFAWTLTSRPDGSAAILAGSTTMHPSFVADLPGEYVAALIVTDADGLSSDPDVVVVSSSNTAPVANAGVDKGAFVGEPVTLDGSASYDLDMDPLEFSWTLAAPDGSQAALTDATTAFPTFIPNVPGAYTVTLMVSDLFGGVSADSVVVSVIAASEFAEAQTVSALNLVGSLTLAQVTTRGNRQALQNFLTQVIAALQGGDIDEARTKLTQAIERTDGCIVRGSIDQNGSGRDWVIDCAAQTQLHQLLAAALEALTW